MTCCSLLVAATLAMGYGDAVGNGGSFATPMFLRGQPVWTAPVSRRELRRHMREQQNSDTDDTPREDVATTLA